MNWGVQHTICASSKLCPLLVYIDVMKTVLPTQMAPNHGTLVDTGDLTAQIPIEKVQAFTAVLTRFKGKRYALLMDWQSLIGHLSYALHVIPTGVLSSRSLLIV